MLKGRALAPESTCYELHHNIWYCWRDVYIQPVSRLPCFIHDHFFSINRSLLFFYGDVMHLLTADLCITTYFFLVREPLFPLLDWMCGTASTKYFVYIWSTVCSFSLSEVVSIYAPVRYGTVPAVRRENRVSDLHLGQILVACEYIQCTSHSEYP